MHGYYLSRLHVPFTTTAIGRTAFRYAAPTIWNSTPLSIRSLPSLNSFKRSLKTHLFSLDSPWSKPCYTSASDLSFVWICALYKFHIIIIIIIDVFNGELLISMHSPEMLFEKVCDFNLSTHYLQNLTSSEPNCGEYLYQFWFKDTGSRASEFTRLLWPSFHDLDLWTNDLENLISVTSNFKLIFACSISVITFSKKSSIITNMKSTKSFLKSLQ